ncbi:MAG: transcriptional repressor [Pseudomonadota bacterium]
MSTNPAENPAFASHDHSDCVERVLATAETLCKDRKVRLTPIRRQALEILISEHKALGAYDILAELSARGQAAHPPVAYRALDFLVTHGLAHKIERLAAYVACAHPGERHRPAFLICRICQLVAEAHVPNNEGALGSAAKALGFQIEETVIEAEGICPECQKAAA